MDAGAVDGNNVIDLTWLKASGGLPSEQAERAKALPRAGRARPAPSAPSRAERPPQRARLAERSPREKGLTDVPNAGAVAAALRAAAAGP